MLDQLPVGIVIAEAPSGRILGSNRYARELFGGTIAATDVTEYATTLVRLGGQALEPDEVPLARAVLHGETVQAERLELELDGKPRMLSANATPIRTEDGEVVAAVVVVEDVSERERAARAESEFVANAAHELRTPLAAIAGSIEVLQAGAKELPAERDLFLDHIERESGRLARLARALLLLARLESSAERPRLEVVPIRALLRDVADSVHPAPSVRVRVRCAGSLAALASRELLEQAVLNLAVNAARHTAEGSITLAGRADRGRAVVEVADTGPGIEPELAGRLFERFHSDGEHADGFGLGLSIARKAVEAGGGTLELDSERDRGTTARIRLPLARLVDP